MIRGGILVDMKLTISTLLIAGLLALLSLPASAQTPTSIDLANLGPQIGDRVADFGLLDQSGSVWTTDSILGPNGALLVFSRSADW